MRIAAAEAAQADALEPVLGERMRLGPRHALEDEAGGDVVQRAFPGHQRLGLEQIAGARVDVLERLAEDLRLALQGREQAGGHVQQRGFSSVRGTDDGDEFSRADVQVDVAHGV